MDDVRRWRGRVRHRGKHLSGADLRGRDLQRVDLADADLRGADLREADLREADLRRADLRGAELKDADLSRALLHGADLRETRCGASSLGHIGGDPELEWISNPALAGARADDDTLWPAGTSNAVPSEIVYDGPDVLALKGPTLVIPPGDASDPRALRPAAGRVVAVLTWSAICQLDAGPVRTVSGRSLLHANLSVLIGQRVRRNDGWWRIVDADPGARDLLLERDGMALRMDSEEVFEANVNRWWWHVPVG